MALFYTHAYDRIIAPGFADFDSAIKSAPNDLRQAFARFEKTWQHHASELFAHAA